MNWFGGGILLILAGGVAALIFRHRPRTADNIFRFLALAGCVLAGVAAARTLLGGRMVPVSFRTTLPGGPWVAGLDQLSAWFVLLLCIVAAAAVSYGVTYLAKARASRSVASAHALLSLLVASMLGVFAAQAAVPFLVAWEMMAVSAYLLIVFDHDHPGVQRAGMVYLVMTHVGTLALLGMFLAWGHSSGDLSFSRFTPAAARLVSQGAPILLLATFGFGIKAGVFPFHFWLPGAHAAAPSHVSALLSGVMIKTGIYGLLRVLWLFGAPPPWWGWTIMLLGLASALFGVLSALVQHDLKRALAYSSVDNIGIILLGVGLGALGAAYGYPTLGLLGFSGALLHTFNHALFKSLLFLGAGAVVRTTGTREIDRLGGLARAMPRTAVAFLIGALAIAGLPAINGFVGEWTLIRGFLAAIGETGPIRLAGLGAAGLGLISALTLACFLRLGTTVFLGTPRSVGLQATDDAPGGMGLGFALLAAFCIAIGIGPAVAVAPALHVAVMFSPARNASDIAAALVAASTNGVSLLVAGLLISFALVWALRRRVVRSGETRRSVTWGCAFPAPTPRMQYTGASFSAPLSRAFSASVAPALRHVGSEPGPRGEDRVLRGIATPVWQRLRRLAAELRPLQQGRVTTYLQYIIATVLLLLGFLFFAGAGTS